jgi:CoA:oxalate CoA-transferase
VSKEAGGLLGDVRILDLTRVLAGPYATSLLADMGAEVIKIENPSEPDGARQSPPMINGISSQFMNLNRNKLSLPIDLSVESGRNLFLSLVATADVVVENYRPGVLEKLGLGYEDLSSANCKVILCSVSGFGQTGSYRTRPAYDVIVQAMSGAMSVTGEPGRDPVRLGIPLGDLSGGLFAAIGILAALHDRTVTQKGQRIDVSMLDALTHLMLYYPIDYLNAGVVAGPVGGRHSHIAPYGVLPAKDGYLVLAIFVGKFWRLFCEAIGRTDLISDDRFRGAPDRLKNREALYSILEDVMRTRTREEWSTIFDAVRLPYSPVLTVDQVAEHQVMREREMFLETVHPEAGRVFVSGRPVKFPDRASFEVSPSPSLGRDTDEILTGRLGLTSEEIDELRQAHIIL